MAGELSELRDYIYLDWERVRSMAAQLLTGSSDYVQRAGGVDYRLYRRDDETPSLRQQIFTNVEWAINERSLVTDLENGFDFTTWAPNRFADGQIFRTSGIVRLLDYDWLAQALAGLPAMLRKMAKIEMAALRQSEQGQRLSKQQLQQRSQETQSAIAKIEEFKIDELTDVVRRLYGDIMRLKVRPSREHPQLVLVGSALASQFFDPPAALSQKYGVEVDAGWIVLGQFNMPNPSGPASPIPTGNQMEDSFEQIALLMNNAFRVASAPIFPALSFTPICIYRIAKS